MSTAPLTVTWDTLGIRPGGVVSESSPLVRTVAAASKQLGVTVTFISASTDANIPMSLGIPALAVGHGGRSVGGHSLDETYDAGAHGYRGPQWLLLIAAAIDSMAQGAGGAAPPSGVQAISFLGDSLRTFPLPASVRARYEQQLAEALNR